MKVAARLWIGTLLCVLLLIVVGAVLLRSSDKRSVKPHSPELEYLKAVNSVAPPKDPELMFILMGEFASSNLQDEGAEFFRARLRDFDPQLTPVQKSLYLGITGLLRAQNASRVPLLKRYGYVNDTIATLDQAKQLSGGQVFVMASRNPQHLLHGREPLTRNFSSPLILSHLKTDLAWLQDQVITAIRRGDDRAAIHQANLIPPDLLANQPDAYQPYYILREHVIDRIYDQHVGYWEANLQGLAHPSQKDRAELLVDYLGLSETQILKAADRLSADGRYAMAAELIETAEPKFPNSEAIKRAKRFAYLKLMEKNQNTDPFKFIIYSAKAGEQTTQINLQDVKGAQPATR
jgi:hypothetical protein